MNRREFLRDAAVAGVLANLPSHLAARPAGTAGQTGLPHMAVITGESPAQITKEAIAAVGGMKRFVSRGDKVIIKPNIGWDRTPELAACTNPEVVKTLVELSLEAGAKEVIVTDNSTNSSTRCFARSGIQEAAKAGGARVLLPNENKLKKVPLKGEWLKDWEVFSDYLEADKVINVPIAKHHSLCRLTLGMKNWLGAIGGPRNQLHQRLDEGMVDLAAFFKPCLTVLDAYRMLMRNGPQGGRTSDVKLAKTVAASTDPAAIDAFGASLYEIKPQELIYLPLAAKRGLGEINLEKLQIEKRTV
jgi:uncharacterized protein (DUF362 family)